MIIMNEGVDEYTRGTLISDPKEKKVYNAVCDVIAEFSGNYSGNSSRDKKIDAAFNRYVENGKLQDIKFVADELYKLTGNTDFKF